MLQFVSVEAFFGRHGGVSQPTRAFHLFIVIGERLERDGGAAFAAAEFIVAGVCHGAQQPGAERAAAKAIDAAKRGNEGFLGGISGHVVIAKNAQGGVESAVLVGEYEPVEGIEVTVLGVTDKGGFVHKCLGKESWYE